jgi:hypothetical protein
LLIEQAESDNSNGFVEHATAVDTKNRSGTATAHTSRQRRAASGAAQREQRRSRRVPMEGRQFVGGTKKPSGAPKATTRPPTTTTMRTEADTGPRRGDEGTSSAGVMAASAATMPQQHHSSRTPGDMPPGHTSPAPLLESIFAPAAGPTTPASPCSAVPGGCQLRDDSGAEDESRCHPRVDQHPLRVPLDGPPRRLLIFPLLHTPHLLPDDGQLGCCCCCSCCCCCCCCCEGSSRFAMARRRAVGSLPGAPPPPSFPAAQAVHWYSRLIEDGSGPRPRPSPLPPRPIHRHLLSSRVPSVPWQKPLVLSSPSELFSQDERPAASTLPFGECWLLLVLGGWSSMSVAIGG